MTAPLGDLVEFQRGIDITRAAQSEGDVPVISSGGISSYHNVAHRQGPGVVIGRKGTLGKTFFAPGPYWPHDTTLWVRNFRGNHPRFVYYFMSNLDVSWLDAGSANPTLNRNHLHPILVTWPAPLEQQAIAEVLGALDDKIAANIALAECAEGVASLTYDSLVANWPRVTMSALLDPILGGTPARAREEFWTNGDQLWISARDITAAPSRVVLDSAERITSAAVSQTKAKALPVGSVILTARGTVGEVGRLTRPASFNQSCYGFRPDVVPPGLLYHSLLRAAERARTVAHGSVFDTITKATFDHLDLAWNPVDAQRAESEIAPLLAVVSLAVEESKTLADVRDALLPQLMSGRLRVRDAEAAASDAGA